MTETSYWWTTSGTPTGHQVSSYTQAHLSEILKIAGSCHGSEGVAPAYLSALAGSVPALNTFRVASGGALVDGKAYKNDANVDINIPSAVGGGNTRIDRIVLRATWASFTVVLTRIAGVDAASPTPPAITQNSGSVWDTMLYQVRVNTSGTVTIELDERVWARISTAELDDDAITAAKIATGAVGSSELAADAVIAGKIAASAVQADDLAAGAINNSTQFAAGVVNPAAIGADAVIAGKIADGAVNTTPKLGNDIVDDTKAGNRVPQFYRRQGSDASNWILNGTTDYTPTAVRMQAGSVNVSSNLTITFPVAFSDKPLVFMTPISPYHCRVAVLSATQAILYVFDSSGAGATSIVYWLAIGPE